MAKSCARCGVQLFGAEVDRGICENCERDAPGITSAPGEPLRTPAPPSFAGTGYTKAPEYGYQDRPWGAMSQPEFGPSQGLSWSYVRNGLGLIFWGLLMIPLAVVVGIVLMICGGAVGFAAMGGGG